MRVLHVITALGVGGAENMLLKLLQAPGLSQVQQQVVAMLPGGELANACRATGAVVDEVDLLGGVPLVGGSLRLVQLARRAAPDVVQGWMYHGNLGALLARAVLPRRVPLVWGVRQSLASLDGENAWARVAIHANRLLSDRPEALVFNSNASIEQHRRFGFRNKHVHFLPNGFDGERFRPDTALRARRRQEWGFDGSHLVFGMLARLHPAKGQVHFLEAADRLRASLPAARFVIAGPDHAGQGAALQAQCRAAGLDRVVRVDVGHHAAHELLPAIDVFVSASTAIEAFSNAIGEALCCALPCIATDIGDSAWLVGDAGMVVEPAAPTALAAAMATLAELGTEQRAALGAKGRERVLRDFGIAAVAARFGDLWQGLAALPPQAAAAG